MISDFNNLMDNKQRVKQQSIVPAASKTNIIQQYNSTNNSIEYKNAKQQVVFSINLTTGVISFLNPLTIGVATTFNNPVTMNSTLTISTANSLTYNGITVQAPVKEIQIMLVSSGASGGGVDSFYTQNTSGSPAYIDSARFSIDPSNYPGCTFLLEGVMRAGASGDPGSWTNTLELYDITGSAVVTNSTISTSTKSGSSPGAYPRVRGTINFRGNLTAGARDYTLRFYSSDGTKFVDIYSVKLIIQY